MHRAAFVVEAVFRANQQVALGAQRKWLACTTKDVQSRAGPIKSIIVERHKKNQLVCLPEMATMRVQRDSMQRTAGNTSFLA